MPLFCEHCGSSLDEDAKFCEECGKAVAVSPLPAPPPQPFQQPRQTAYMPVRPAYPAQQQYSPQPAAPQKKKGGWILPYRIIASVLTVVLLVTGIIGIDTRNGGGDRIKRGESASVQNNKIELDGVTLDFSGNNVTKGAKMTVLLPTDKQKPDGMISGLYEVAFAAYQH